MDEHVTLKVKNKEMADQNEHVPIINGDHNASDPITESDENIRAKNVVTDATGGTAATIGKLDEIELKPSGEDKVCKDLLMVPAGGQRKSFMEEESAREKTRQLLLKQCSAILKQTEERYTKETLHKAFQDEDLLERIFRLFDAEGRRSLNQERWLEFLKQRLTEEKQLDFLEQVESVAYVVCGAGDVTPLAFRQVLRNRVVTNKLLKAVDADCDGYVSADEIMNFLSVVTSSRSRAGFDKASVDRLEQLFRKTVGDQQEITKDQFSSIVDSKNAFFRERVFQMFDADHSGTISLQEFISAAHRFAGRTPDDKLRFLFEVYDMDGDGLIQQRELQHALWACMDENGMKFSEEQLEQLTHAMLEDADAEQRGAITYEGLRHQLGKHEGLLENLSISIDRWLVPPQPEPAPASWVQRLARLKPYQLSLPYIRNNYVLIAYLIVYTLVNVGLFAARCAEFQDKNGYFMIAKACGQCLNLNCVWVLVLMLRRCITVLRVRGAGALLPLDHHMYLHKLTGVVILVLSVVHTAAHLANLALFVVPVDARWSLWERLLTSRPGVFGLVGGAANPTGAALVAVLLVMFVCSQPFIRRRGNFEIFYWTHLLYIPFWVLLIFHGPNFWKWFIVPGTIYICEKIIRFVWLRSGLGKTYVSSGILLPSQVTHLVVKRPPLFEFHAGDYVFVNVPAIAGYEWHPFTISSGPDQPDYIWLHVRAVGEWTGRLRAYFEREHERLHGGRRSSSRAASRHKSLSSKRSVEFAPDVGGQDNRAFTPDDDGNTLKPPAPSPRVSWLRPPLRFQKTRSMPDVHDARRQRNSILREYTRSESEYRLSSPGAMAAPRTRSCTPAGALHSRALADSFRYMRHKPAIVAFKTPSYEDAARRRSNDSILTIARRRLSKSISPDKDVETEKPVPETPPADDAAACDDPDYPVGKPLEIYVDGPYGAASSRIFRAQHAALVAAGIGVTPFASILRAVADRLRRARSRCPRCSHEYTAALPRHDMDLNKVDFFWINREQRSFEWFVSLLSQLEIEQAESGGERFLDMHMYITSALQRTDMKAVGLQLALDLLHEKEKRDLITGLKTRTNAGRPNWDKVFQQLAEQRRGKVTVFYCGPPQLARVLRVKCDQFGFHFRKEVF